MAARMPVSAGTAVERVNGDLRLVRLKTKPPVWWLQQLRGGRWRNPAGASGGPIGTRGNADSMFDQLVARRDGK